jgi:hypothetical protein
MDHSVLATLKIKYQYSLLPSHTEVTEEGNVRKSEEKTYKMFIGQPRQGRILSKECWQDHDESCWERNKITLKID